MNFVKLSKWRLLSSLSSTFSLVLTNFSKISNFKSTKWFFAHNVDFPTTEGPLCSHIQKSTYWYFFSINKGNWKSSATASTIIYFHFFSLGILNRISRLCNTFWGSNVFYMFLYCIYFLINKSLRIGLESFYKMLQKLSLVREETFLEQSFSRIS